MGKEVIGAAALALVMLAGCITAPDAEELQAASTGSQVLDELGAIAPPPGNASAAWYALPVRATAEGALVAFEWTVPEGAAVPWGYNEVFDEDHTVVPMEVALLGDAPATLTWALLFLSPGKEGTLDARGGFLSAPVEMTMYSEAGEETMESELPRVAFSDLGFDVLPGERMRVLAIAQADTPSDLAIAFRLLDHDPYYDGSEEEPAASPEAFVTARAGAPPAAPVPLATGSGFHIAGYSDFLFAASPAGGAFGIEMRLGAPDAAWDTPAPMRTMPGAHSFRGAIGSQLDHGVDLADAYYSTLDHQHVDYLARAAVGDEVQESSGRELALGFAGLSLGGGFAGGGAYVVAAQDGASESVLELDRVTANGFYSAASLSLIEFGATMEELFGVALTEESAADAQGGVLPVLAANALVSTNADRGIWTMALPDTGMPATMLR